MDDAQLEAACLAGVRAALPPGVRAELRRSTRDPRGLAPDARIEIHAQGGSWGIPLEVRRRFHAASLALADRRLRRPEPPRTPEARDERPPWILFTEHATLPQACDLRARRIAFADAVGNVHLWGPGLYVWVAGNRPETRRSGTIRLTRPAAARVLFALLQDPRRAHSPYRELAATAGVAPDTVNRVLNDLERKGYLKVWGKRGRALVRLPELLELWTLAYQDGLRPKLEPRRCQQVAPGRMEELATLLASTSQRLPVLLGGEAGAAMLTDALRPATAVLHVPPAEQRQIMQALRLLPKPDGPITLLHTFGATNEWQPPDRPGTRMADPLLIHAELMREEDDRLRSTAAQIYDRHIAMRFADAQ
jgi:hypothetical protein